jgi:hypothetical protein
VNSCPVHTPLLCFVLGLLSPTKEVRQELDDRRNRFPKHESPPIVACSGC